MTDEEFNEQKQRIETLIERWKEPLGLGWWNIDFQYCREGEMAQTHGDTDGSAFVNLMDCEVQWQYLHANIRVNMPAVAQVDDADLETAFVHELMHIYVAEMRVPEWSGAPNEIHHSMLEHEERVVTSLARAMCWMRDHAIQEGVKLGQFKRQRKDRKA